MATSVASVFDADVVRKVVNELLEAGLERRNIAIVEGDADEARAEVAGRGFGEEDVRAFEEAVRRGKALVAAQAPEEKLDRAAAIMDRYEAGGQEQERGRAAGEESVPVVEEELEVGKRKVVRGGVRVTSHVVERPVEEKVRLREEHVEAGRERVDRRLSPEEAEAAFKERTVEMTETAEEAEVAKEARVVEQVSLEKRAEEHEATVRDKVRRTEVEVEELAAKPRAKR
jgi:stress response protein YsnF